MKIFNRILSYLIVFLLGCVGTLTALNHFRVPISKLDQLEYVIQARFIGDSDKTKMEDAAARGMISALGDRWSYYISAAQYDAFMEQQENAYVGIGITLQTDENSFLISAVNQNSPAMAAGLMPGDLIVSAGGQSVTGMTTDDLRNIIRGKEGTSVSIGILRDDTVLELEVMRAQILTDVVTFRMLDHGIGLISIDNFDARCASESIQAIEALREQGAKALIFDVRNNPGGYAHELVALLDYLLPEGDLFRTVDYAGNESVDRSNADYLDMPMAVLCNGETYSAAEFFAAAIQEYNAGCIIGTPTCGKGYFQTVFNLNDGSAVGLSIGKYFTPMGKSLTDVGIQPDIPVEVDNETARKIAYQTLDPAEDPQIQAAVNVLLTQISVH